MREKGIIPKNLNGGQQRPAGAPGGPPSSDVKLTDNPPKTFVCFSWTGGTKNASPPEMRRGTASTSLSVLWMCSVLPKLPLITCASSKRRKCDVFVIFSYHINFSGTSAFVALTTSSSAVCRVPSSSWIFQPVPWITTRRTPTQVPLLLPRSLSDFRFCWIGKKVM